MNKKDKLKKAKSQTDDLRASNKDSEVDSFIQDAKNRKFNYSIIISLLVLIVISIYFQYQYEKSRRLSREDNSEEIDYYEVMGLDPNADVLEIKRKYKELARVW